MVRPDAPAAPAPGPSVRRLRPALAVPVAAQQAEDGGAAGLVLPTITIFGDRNAATLDQTASSVAVVTGEQIGDASIFGYRDAFRLMGNVTEGDWTDGGFVIRGVNSEAPTLGGAPLASVYMDGVQQTVNGMRRGAGGMFDMEQWRSIAAPSRRCRAGRRWRVRSISRASIRASSRAASPG